MIISYSDNDIIKKEVDWKLFAKKNNFIFKKSQTNSREINILRMECNYKNISIFYSESDSRPLNIQFSFDVKNDFYFSIFEESNFDKVLGFFKKDLLMYNKSKYKGQIIKSNNFDEIKLLINDELFADLISMEDVYSLYAESKAHRMNINISTSYKEKKIDNLDNYYRICCHIIEYLT